MNTYCFEGRARLSGAIGVTHFFSAEVVAESPEAARLKLYDKYEHITITHATVKTEEG